MTNFGISLDSTVLLSCWKHFTKSAAVSAMQQLVSPYDASVYLGIGKLLRQRVHASNNKPQITQCSIREQRRKGPDCADSRLSTLFLPKVPCEVFSVRKTPTTLSGCLGDQYNQIWLS